MTTVGTAEDSGAQTPGVRRKARAATAWLASWVVLAGASDAAAFSVSFDPQAFGGRYRVHTVPIAAGPRTIDLAPGSYGVDNGTGVGGSAFLLTVAADGTLSVSNPDAADVIGSTVQFRNVTITVQPGAYAGQHRISSYSTVASSGVVSRVLIPALRYCLDNGASIAGSSFCFLVDAGGSVTSQSAASAEGVGPCSS